MGTSHPETKPWVVQHIIDSGARSVMDVGAGAGGWLDALRAAGYIGRLTAVEVWEPYVYAYRLLERYDEVVQADVRHLTPHQFARHDVVIFGDVLEHMTRAEALRVWGAAHAAPHAAIAIPIVHYCQGALNDNPYEEHVVDNWTDQKVREAFPGITDSQAFTITGAYWR